MPSLEQEKKQIRETCTNKCLKDYLIIKIVFLLFFLLIDYRLIGGYSENIKFSNLTLMIVDRLNKKENTGLTCGQEDHQSHLNLAKKLKKNEN